MSSVRRGAAGPELDFDDDERALLRHLLGELDELLGEHAEPEADAATDADAAAELARLVGIGTSTQPPLDPALARLFPDAYTGDAPAAGDFRRYTEDRLRATKRDRLEAVREALGREGPYLLDGQHVWSWLGALNDLRLVLGVRLDVDEDDDPEERLTEEGSEPYLFYLWLTEVQGALLATLEDPPG